jgi:hypothetical protein
MLVVLSRCGTPRVQVSPGMDTVIFRDLQKHDLEQGLSAVYARALVPVFARVFRTLLTLEIAKKQLAP